VALILKHVEGMQTRRHEGSKRPSHESWLRVLVFSLLPALTFVIVAKAPAAAQEKKDPGQAAFVRVCEPCHGPQGNGAGQGPALVPYGKDLSELVAIVRSGLGLMPAIPKSDITDEEIGQVHAYLKELTSKSAHGAQMRSR